MKKKRWDAIWWCTGYWNKHGKKVWHPMGMYQSRAAARRYVEAVRRWRGVNDALVIRRVEVYYVD